MSSFKQCQNVHPFSASIVIAQKMNPPVASGPVPLDTLQAPPQQPPLISSFRPSLPRQKYTCVSTLVFVGTLGVVQCETESLHPQLPPANVYGKPRGLRSLTCPEVATAPAIPLFLGTLMLTSPWTTHSWSLSSSTRKQVHFCASQITGRHLAIV